MLVTTLLVGLSICTSLADECKKIAPHWDISEPLSIAEAEKASLEKMREERPDWPQVPFGRGNEEWELFKGQFSEGDVLVYVSMDAPPGLPHGYTGYVRLRAGCAQDFFLLTS